VCKLTTKVKKMKKQSKSIAVSKQLTPEDQLKQTMQAGGEESRAIAAAMSMSCPDTVSAYLAGYNDASIPLPESRTHVHLPGHKITNKYRVQIPWKGHRVTIGYATTLVEAAAMSRGAVIAFEYTEKVAEYEEFSKGASTTVTSVPTVDTVDLPDEFQDLLDFATVRMVDEKWVDSNGKEVVVSLDAN
jgi:hypothetical protein